MQYTVLGFQQEIVVKLGLNIIDLQILRWFIDFYHTDSMKQIVEDNKIWAWVNYKHVIRELPVLNIKTKRMIANHFDKLVKAGVLEKKLNKKEGNYTYFSVVKKTYQDLVRSNKKNDTPYVNKFTKGVSTDLHTPLELELQSYANEITNIYSNTNILLPDNNSVVTTSPLYINPNVVDISQTRAKKNDDQFINNYSFGNAQNQANNQYSDNRSYRKSLKNNDILEELNHSPTSIPPALLASSSGNRIYRRATSAPKKTVKNKNSSPKNSTTSLDEFQPNETHHSLAAANNLNIQSELDSFRDYCLSSGKKYKDLSATFRNWLRRANDFKRTGVKKYERPNELEKLREKYDPPHRIIDGVTGKMDI